MALSPLLIFGLLLAGGVATTAVSHFRPRWAWGTAVGVLAMVWLAWFLLGRRLPLLATSDSASPLTFVWQWDEMGWQLSGVWLLLVTAVQVASDKWRVTSEEGGPANSPLPYLLLAVAGLLPLLAGNLATSLVATTLLIGVWSVVLWLVEPVIHNNVARLLPRAIWLMLSLLFIWLASAFAPDKNSLVMATWPRMATSSVLTAALLLMGFWPFYGWRSDDWRLPPALAALVHAAPTLAGLFLLVRLVSSSDVGMGYSLFLTAFGLLGLLVGLRRAWSDQTPGRMAAALLLAQVNLAGLALVWVGAVVAVTEARALILVGGILFLADTGGRVPGLGAFVGKVLRLVGPVTALATLAGLPLLTGFAGRAGLYTAWWASGRYVLLLAAALLHIPLVTAVGWHFLDRPTLVEEDDSAAGSHRSLVHLAGELILAAGLLSTSGLAGVTGAAWLALLLPLGGRRLVVLFDECGIGVPAGRPMGVCFRLAIGQTASVAAYPGCRPGNGRARCGRYLGGGRRLVMAAGFIDHVFGGRQLVGRWRLRDWRPGDWRLRDYHANDF